MLIKCSGGQDRTGLAAALYLLRRGGQDALGTAETQFALWPYLHRPEKFQRWLRYFPAYAVEDAKGVPLLDWANQTLSAGKVCRLAEEERIGEEFRRRAGGRVKTERSGGFTTGRAISPPPINRSFGRNFASDWRCTALPAANAANGAPLSVEMTNFGGLGWFTDAEMGYRYEAHHPEWGTSWPRNSRDTPGDLGRTDRLSQPTRRPVWSISTAQAHEWASTAIRMKTPATRQCFRFRWVTPRFSGSGQREVAKPHRQCC